MDTLSRQAALDYHQILRDDDVLVREIEERFQDRLVDAGTTFGGRALCTSPCPSLISVAAYERVRRVCRDIMSAVDKIEAQLGDALADRVGVTPEERALMSTPQGHGRSAPLARLDSFLTTRVFQFVELNAEPPAGGAYNDALADVFLELDVMKRFQKRYCVTPFRVQTRLLETLVGCYRAAGGVERRPSIAIVDYVDVPTRSEQLLCRDSFEREGYPSFLCDPRELSFESGELRAEGRKIDILYRRLLVNELLERRDELGPLLAALEAGAVTVVNPLQCKALHKKALFAVLTDDGMQSSFSPGERETIAAHIPWTRVLHESRSRYRGKEIDLVSFARRNQERLVLKPNDEYGGKGISIGAELSASEWDAALGRALAGAFIVQEKVEITRSTFPQLAPTLEFRDLVVDVDPYLFNGEVHGFLTRLSSTSLANVTSGAGQVPSFLVAPR
jgi:hypothetical protein